MKTPIVTTGLLALGITLASLPAVASEMEERFREEGKSLDLTGFFNAETDAHSRSFLFGSVNAHDFTVTEAGQYRFTSRVNAGYADDYRIAAVLEDAQGNVIARSEALGQNGGLEMRQQLAPGDYVLRVEAQRFGTRGRGGDGYSVHVAGLDEQGRVVDDSVSDGEGFFFTGKNHQGGTSVFVRGEDTVATLGGGAGAAATADAPRASESMASAEPASDEPREPAPVAGEQQGPSGVGTIVTDVKIRARGEVLTFNMAERGSVTITTSTYPTGYEDTYRIELEVLDDSGRVVAEGAGQGFDGDVELTTELAPGRYRIRVQGQQFGSAMSGVNNYELRVEKR
ncbi:hypothetical protein [Halomonas organivorans]|uniref:ABC transporter substrate-binding protein n=1 Tax=Halomonas organivorans TaxID=257772 RepID=A0A7W5C2D7_9GAMM|nr:hypothetical protein [Halomonas organivorans]MBB3143377.1 hypothetical protein [Halomonas organivorans]